MNSKPFEKPVMHVLLGKPASGKTRWALKQGREECCGFEVAQMRVLLKDTTLGSIAISSTQVSDLEADERAIATKARGLVQAALGGPPESEFEVSVLRFP
jgi:hypothetical protein